MEKRKTERYFLIWLLCMAMHCIKNGYAKEGHKVLETLLDAAMDFENSRMYPGIPEYFDNQGRGLYAYLTGAASWYMLTMITEVFGVRGDLGDLVIAPALMPKQYK